MLAKNTIVFTRNLATGKKRCAVNFVIWSTDVSDEFALRMKGGFHKYVYTGGIEDK